MLAPARSVLGSSRAIAALVFALVVVAASACSDRVPGFMPDGSMNLDGSLDAPIDGARPDAGDGATDVRTDGRSDARDASGDGASDADVDAMMCMTFGGEVPYRDRTMDAEFTVPETCAACPGAFVDINELDDADMLPADTTTLRVSGTSSGAINCEWYVIGGSCGVTHGTVGTDPDGAGVFDVTLPIFCGTNVVQLVCMNGAGSRVLVRRVSTPSCSRDLRVTLTWDDVGDDLELHLIRAGGLINDANDDCTWNTCVPPRELDWGATGDTSDDPTKDIDDLDEFGPENIYLSNAPPDTYRVMVEHWGTSGSPSDADVDIAIGERTVARVHIDDLDTHWVWDVGSISFPDGTFTPVEARIDCSPDDAWNGSRGTSGCDLTIP